MKQIKKAAYVKSAVRAPFFSSNQIIVFTILVCSVKLSTNFSMSSDVVFTVVALINPLRRLCTLCIPNAIQCGSETIITIQRIQVRRMKILPPPWIIYSAMLHIIMLC